MSPVRLLIVGASGKMGGALRRVAAGDASLQVIAAVAREPDPTDASLTWLPPSQLDTVAAFDVAVDFSQPTALPALVDLCRARRSALVSGTTGLGVDDWRLLDAAAANIPLLWAANFSLGVAVLNALVARAAASLPQWDVDLIEAHHTQKRDAPSGTALALGKSVLAARGIEPSYHSLRAGDIVGEHCVQFSGIGERIELIHRATDRDVFARGALHAARWLVGKPAGRYGIEDSLGLR